MLGFPALLTESIKTPFHSSSETVFFYTHGVARSVLRTPLATLCATRYALRSIPIFALRALLFIPLPCTALTLPTFPLREALLLALRALFLALRALCLALRALCFALRALWLCFWAHLGFAQTGLS